MIAQYTRVAYSPVTELVGWYRLFLSLSLGTQIAGKQQGLGSCDQQEGSPAHD